MDLVDTLMGYLESFSGMKALIPYPLTLSFESAVSNSPQVAVPYGIPSDEKTHFAQSLPSFHRQPVSNNWLRLRYKFSPPPKHAYMHSNSDKLWRLILVSEPTVDLAETSKTSSRFNLPSTQSGCTPFPSFLFQGADLKGTTKFNARVFPRKPDLNYRITLFFTESKMIICRINPSPKKNTGEPEYYLKNLNSCIVD